MTKTAFNPINLSWAGRTFTIPANRVLGAIARVENALTLADLHRAFANAAPPLGKLSQAYGALLRYAGLEITDEDVYVGMFTSPETASVAMEAVETLIVLMVPPAALEALERGEPPKGNPPRRTRRAAASSSRKATKRQSAAAG